MNSDSQSPSRNDTTKDYPLLIPYQVNFNTTTTGKHISLTKRHCKWRFGFAHIPSVCAGNDSVDCRGMELDIHLVWSIASGKYCIYINRILIHHSITSTAGLIQKFEHSFSLPEDIFPGHHVIQIIAWATETTCHLSKGQTQFDLKLDGQSFTQFLRIFELGSVRMNSIYGQAIDNLVQKGKVEAIDKSYSNRNRIKETANTTNTDSNRSAHDIVGGRPRYQVQRTFTQKHVNQGTGSNYGRTFQRPLIATTTEEEKKLIAQARLNSLKDLQKNASSNHTSSSFVPKPPMSPPSSDSHHRQQMHVPARPTAAKVKTKHAPLKPVQEGKDLLDMNSLAPECEILRTSSSLTMDTTLRNLDDESIDYYSHLDPKQMWKTSQNLPFRPQQPPQYADSLAGDLIQPSPSGTSNIFHNMNNNVDMGFAMPPNETRSVMKGSSPDTSQQMMNDSIRLKPGHLPFKAPPPPSWETLNAEFGSQRNMASPSSSVQFNSQPIPQQYHQFQQH